jgi:hypothetical protein
MIKSTNTNCLTGMECPGCKSDGPFTIQATALFTIHNVGTQALGDVEYDEGLVHESSCWS